MITVSILGTLTVLVAQAIQQSIKTKTKMQGQLEDVSHLRDAVRLLERDISQAYHYRDVEKELADLLKKKNQGGNNPNPATMTPEQQAQQAMLEQQQLQQQMATREVPRRDPETNFVGNNETLNFVTMNNARTVRNSKQADFVEVGYELKECRSLREDGGSSKCVWRRSSPYVDLDVTKGGDEVVLLENVSEFKFRYLGKGKQDWVNDWRTDAQGDGATKGKFPQAVELSVTVQKKTNGKERKYSMQVIIPLHFPNNPEETSNAQSSQTLTQ
jgi:type II secretory pathway component PulJ